MDGLLQTSRQLEIQAFIAGREFGPLKNALCELETHELAELLADLPDKQELAVAFRLLPTELAAEVMGTLEPDQQEDLLENLSQEKTAEILQEMPPDDRTELLEELPGQLAQRLLTQLRGKEQDIARSLLAYPEDSIGRLMTPEYVAVRASWTIEQVFRHIRRIAGSRETFNIVYVVDERWRLLDEIPLETLVLAEPEQLVEELMDEQVACLVATDDQEAAVDAFRKYDAVALPVVDGRYTLVGIVTVDDVMDVAEEESTEDMQKMAGMSVLEYSYMRSSFGQMLKSRLPWLMMLLVFQIGAVLVLKEFDYMLAMLAMFMPLINATAGNTGSQVAGLMIRAFAVQELEWSHWRSVVRRELGRGVAMGAILAITAGCIVLLVGAPESMDTTHAAIAASVAMLCAVTLANLIGTILPFFFHRIGMDPAVTSGPFVACVMDISSILIFFSIASAILGGMG